MTARSSIAKSTISGPSSITSSVSVVLLLAQRILDAELAHVLAVDLLDDRVAAHELRHAPLRLGPVDHEVPLPGHVARDEVGAHDGLQLGLADVVLEERELRVRRLPVGGDAVDVLVVRDREELLQRALGARVAAVAHRRNVALGVARVLQVRVGLRVVDVPVFLDPVRLLGLVLVGLDDLGVELRRGLVGGRVGLVGPVFGLRAGSAPSSAAGAALLSSVALFSSAGFASLFF
jgi:hypothetical protein